MTLLEILEQDRSAVLERWRGLVLESYSEEAACFFRGEKDRFQNPVGHSIARATAVLYDGVVLDRQPEGIPEALESLVRLRAVQDFTASQALAFVFQLKRAVREQAAQHPDVDRRWEELSRFETRIDALAFAAFDLYVESRERIFEIRQGELKRRIASLLRRLGGESEPEAEPIGSLGTGGRGA